MTTEHDSICSTSPIKSPWPLTRSTELTLAIAAVAIQIVILVAMIVLDGLPLLLGERIKLKVVPVDPHDFFRGDYVVLSYDFSRFDPAGITGENRNAPNPDDTKWIGRDVYVALTPAGDHHDVASCGFQRPASGPFIQGKAAYGWPNRVECGIEAFFVQEGEGKRLENLIREKKIMAEVAVLNGKAKLVRLIE